MPAATESEYRLLVKQAQALTEDESDWIANTANISALLFNSLHRVNFAGVYRMKNGELVLGPFQGLPACVHIPLGRGVCGKAAEKKKAQIVEDVHQFKGHIACDSASKSEIVVPIFKGDNLWGVLDIDSIKTANFTPEDLKYLQQISAIIFA